MSTITATPFSVGPVNFTSVTYTNTATPGLPTMDFTIQPGAYPEQYFSPTDVVLWMPGRYYLSPSSIAQTVSETLTLDYSSPDYLITGVSVLGVATDSGNTTTENIFLTSPCSTVLHGDGEHVGCGPSIPPHSGTLSVSLDIHSLPCVAGVTCHGGVIGLGYIKLSTVHNPEPTAALLILGGLLVLCGMFKWRGSNAK